MSVKLLELQFSTHLLTMPGVHGWVGRAFVKMSHAGGHVTARYVSSYLQCYRRSTTRILIQFRERGAPNITRSAS
jgi:hypothetical protein